MVNQEAIANKQLEILDKIDPSKFASAAEEASQRAQSAAALAGTAAEITTNAQPLLDAVGAMGVTLRAVDARLQAIEAAQRESCFCSIM